MNKASDLEDTSINDRYANRMHAVPPTTVVESNSKPSKYAFGESDSSLETTTSMLEQVENAPKVVCKPKVWTDAPIIKEYETDSDNDSVSNDDPHRSLKDNGIVDSGCSRYMTGNKAHLADYQEFRGGSDAFGDSNGRISGKGKIKADKLDFEDVYYVEELKHYNQVLLKIPKQHNMYSFNLKNIDPSRDLSCLFTKASIDKSNKWHKRLGHVNFKNLNKLVKGNLVRGLPSKIFENDHLCCLSERKATQGLFVKTASAPIKTQKPLVKEEEAADVYVLGHFKDFTPSGCEEIFRYLKGQPKLGLWYPKVSLFNLEAYSDSDYAGANLDRLLWLLLLQRQNMLLLHTAVDKFCGFRINY
nr:hypothetical protein [Tanacetum cinerariifolium]